MQLRSTIELSPYDYAKTEYSYPDASGVEASEAWNTFWLRCISDRGLGSLRAVREGSYLVDVESIADRELGLILQQELSELDLEDAANIKNEVVALSGGIVVVLNQEVIIEPSCCGDLGNLADWEAIMHVEPNQWQQLWIGHPWLFYRRRNGLVEFSDYSESSLVEHVDPGVKYMLPENALRTELSKMRAVQDNFEKRLGVVLAAMQIRQAVEIAKRLVGNA